MHLHRRTFSSSVDKNKASFNLNSTTTIPQRRSNHFSQIFLSLVSFLLCFHSHLCSKRKRLKKLCLNDINLMRKNMEFVKKLNLFALQKEILKCKINRIFLTFSKLHFIFSQQMSHDLISVE